MSSLKVIDKGYLTLGVNTPWKNFNTSNEYKEVKYMIKSFE